MKFRMLLISPPAEPLEVPELEAPPDVAPEVAPVAPLPVPLELVPLVVPPLLPVAPLPLLEP